MLETFVKDCRSWAGLMLEQFVEGCFLWEGPHTGAGEKCEEFFPRGGGNSRDNV